MSKQRRMSAGLVICATCRPMKATSSMSAVPSEYQGSSTQSWPKPTRMPALDHLRHAGHAAALGIGVVAALQDDVDQRIGDRRHAGLGNQRQQFRDVVIVHRMHRGQMRAGHPAAEPEPLRLVGKLFDVARQRDRRSRRNACRPSARVARRFRRARSPSGGHPPWCARNAGCRRRCRRRGRAHGWCFAWRSASGKSRPAGRRRAADRDRARRAS